jgi:hypothetical protein
MMVVGFPSRKDDYILYNQTTSIDSPQKAQQWIMGPVVVALVGHCWTDITDFHVERPVGNEDDKSREAHYSRDGKVELGNMQDTLACVMAVHPSQVDQA